MRAKVQSQSISSGLIEPIDKITLCASNLFPKQNSLIEITDDTIEKIKKELDGIPIQSDLKLSGYNRKLSFVPIDIDITDYNKIISPNTELKIISVDKTVLIETSDTKELFKGDFNFMDMGCY